ncbi:exported hypothetical protein [uncultured Paludibacter sp.]|nr:exported hypothetical protein [uncultured Paludibacter sp.]
MVNNKIKLQILILLICTCLPALAYKPKTKKYYVKYQYVEEEYIPLKITGKKSSHIDNSMVQRINLSQSDISNNTSDYAYQDYTSRTPFEESFTVTQQNNDVIPRPMRDDELPGDPGQMPISDGVWFLLGAVFVYNLYKRKLIIGLKIF